MLEIRIHCKFLPQNFNGLENFIAPITYSPLNNHRKSIDVKNKRHTIIQEGKRIWLNYILDVYEIKIREYELQYQCEFIKLKSQLSNNNTHIIPTTVVADGCSSLFHHITEYLNYRINNVIHDIYIEMPSFRRIILQNRQRSSSTQNTIGVSPESYLDLIMNPFNARQWNQLSFGNIFLSKIEFRKKQIYFRSILYTIKSKCHSSSMPTTN